MRDKQIFLRIFLEDFRFEMMYARRVVDGLGDPS